MKKKKKEAAHAAFLTTVSHYMERNGTPFEIEKKTVIFGVVKDANSYEVSLHYEPKRSRVHFNCLTRNAFPEEKRTAVIDLLAYLAIRFSPYSGIVQIGFHQNDLTWAAHFQSSDGTIDDAFIDKVIRMGVETFSLEVRFVKQVIDDSIPWDEADADDFDARWN